MADYICSQMLCIAFCLENCQENCNIARNRLTQVDFTWLELRMFSASQGTKYSCQFMLQTGVKGCP
jgi:hypothetical protein